MSINHTFRIAGGRIKCAQCQAKSKRTGVQCRAPASKGKTKCRFHGGASSGPRTPEGRQRCAAAKTLHGQETTKIRKERRIASARLAVFEMVGHALGFMHGVRNRGPKPAMMSKVERELQQIVRNIPISQRAKN